MPHHALCQARVSLSVALLLVLAACSGPASLPSGDGPPNDDGRGDQAPAAPTLTVTPTAIRTFLLTWDTIPDANAYHLLEDPTGADDLLTIATLPGSATSHLHEVPLPARTGARYQLQACNEHGCTASTIVPVTGTLRQAIGYVKASNRGAFNGYVGFGMSVALSADGTTLAVGATGERSDASGIDADPSNLVWPNAGAVYVFVRTGSGTWAQQAYIKASNAHPFSYFGGSVALSADGNTLAVGATGESSSATGVGGDQTTGVAPSAGAVYVFARTDGTWTQEAYVKASNTDAQDRFGRSVALSADGATLVVGANYEASHTTGIDGDQTNDDVPGSGAVYLFRQGGGNGWLQSAYVKPSNTWFGQFGASVALSADATVLAVGADRERSSSTGIGGDDRPDDTTLLFAGAVYLY